MLDEIKELQQIENWTAANYQRSLEILRDDPDNTDRLRDEIDHDLIYEIIDFGAGWLEAFEALPTKDKEYYQAAFKRL